MREIIMKLDTNPIITNDYMKTYGITEHNNDLKLAGLDSCNTSSRDNSFCERMSKIPNTICSKCYARKQLNRFKDQRKKYQVSMNRVLNEIIPDYEIPTLSTRNIYDVFRIESFGELHSINEGGLNQVINYINLIRKNNHINFGWWTKRPNIINEAVKMGYEIPENVNIIYSNPYINGLYENGKKYNVNKVIEKYSFVKGVFTVYTAEYATNHNIKINCGGRSCINCLNCYNAHKENVFYINELLK